MDGFYNILRSDQELDDDEVHFIQNVFMNHRLKFKQLMETGELKMTDVELALIRED